jgi:triosephosphate isomerase
MHRKKTIIGNWKMHGSSTWNLNMLTQLKSSLEKIEFINIGLCIPYVYLTQAKELLKDSMIKIGAQNVSQYNQGAHTGSISASMISDIGCDYAIIGHSERRALSSETFESATNRFIQTLEAGLTPIFCVGEKQEERDRGYANAVVESQLRSVLGALEKRHIQMLINQKTIFSYEPAWAIGTGVNAAPAEAEKMHQLIRNIIADIDQNFADAAIIIYGGSMNSKNVHDLLSMENIDGGLVGRSSINIEEFTNICHIANSFECEGVAN